MSLIGTPQGAHAGRVVVITGADSGLGLAFAQTFIDQGAQVALVVRTSTVATVEGVVAEHGWEDRSRVFGVNGLAASASDLMDQIDLAFGRMDVLVNNAGRRLVKRFEDVDGADWANLMDANARDPFFVSQAFAKALARSGSPGTIINIASQLGLVGARDYSLYSISKGALISLTRALAIELARQGVTVNAVAPGPTNTVRAGLLGDQDEVVEFLQRMPIVRRVEPSEIADAVSYLATNVGGAVTGHTLVVDGGWTAW